MIEKGRKKGTIRFCLQPDRDVKKAQLAGSFNGWQVVPMRKQKDGKFIAVVPLEPGTYEYRFLVDGCWQSDPDNHCWAPNPYGTMNSVACVE